MAANLFPQAPSRGAGANAASASHPKINGSHREHGVVLVIALILLVVISLLAVTSLRNAGSSEAISGNVRTTELATQAAEAALRHCEAATIQLTKKADITDASYYDTEFPENQIHPAPATVTTTLPWQSTVTWDTATSTSTATYALPTSKFAVGSTSIYKRSPECMVVQLSGAVQTTASTTSSAPASFVITARGFGPEVPALTSSERKRPVGTEIWLQSTIEIE